MTVFHPRRVVIVVNSLLVLAGVEKRTIELCDYLREHGCEVEIFVLRSVGKIAEQYRRKGVPVRFLHAYDYEEETGYYHLRPLGVVRLWLELLFRRFGVFLLVQPPSSIFCSMLLVPGFGRKVIAMERYLIRGRSRRRLWFDWIMAQAVDRVVCVSRLLRDQALSATRIPERKLVVIEDGVSVEPVQDRLEWLRAWSEGRFVFGCVGLLTNRKRQSVLLRAFAQLLAQWPGSSVLVIVGSGEDDAALKALSKELGIDSAVCFTGEQKNPHDFYPHFGAFIFPSIKEGLGNVWAEAMLHGVPVACADVRPMNDYISHGETGLLVKPDDPSDLSAAMVRLMQDRECRARLAGAALKFAQEHFDRETQLRKLVDLALGA